MGDKARNKKAQRSKFIDASSRNKFRKPQELRVSADAQPKKYFRELKNQTITNLIYADVAE